MSSTTGTNFRATTFGESHGPAVGVVVDGCPPRLPLTTNDIQTDLDRRRPGQSNVSGTTLRNEPDTITILSGVTEGITTGDPIAMVVHNTDQKPGAYANLASVFRPNHADWTYFAKYGTLPASGGGRASARETIGRVAAGAVARKILAQLSEIEIVSWVEAIHDVSARSAIDPAEVEASEVYAAATRCPLPEFDSQMQLAIETARRSRDSVGGVVSCITRNMPTGWDLGPRIAAAVMSLPAVKAVEIEGGDYPGEPILTRVGFKPIATIFQKQRTITVDGTATEIEARGRHDVCVAPRAVPIVEACLLLVLADAAVDRFGDNR